MDEKAVMVSDLSDSELDAVAAGNGWGGYYSSYSSYLKVVQVSNSTNIQGGNVSVLSYKSSQSNNQSSSSNQSVSL